MQRALAATRNVLLILAITFLMDLAASQVCKRYCKFWVNLDQIYDLRMRSEIYDHDLNRNISGPARWGNDEYQLVTNSLGFKDRENRKISLTSDRHRILFIGDSFTEGVGLDYDDTFVGLASAALGACNAEVLNAAVISYSPTIYYRKLKYLIETLGLRVDEVIVFIDISDIQDEAQSYELDADEMVLNLYKLRNNTPSRRFRRWVRDNSMIVKLGYTIGDYIRTYRPNIEQAAETGLLLGDTAARIDRATDNWRSAWTHDLRAWRVYGERGLEKAKRRMDRLAALLRRHEIPLTVAVYPWPAQIFENDRDSIQVVAWRDWAKENNVTFVDMFPAFLDAGTPVDLLLQLFIPFDIHWNAVGHELVAHTLLSNLRIRGSAFKECVGQMTPTTQ